MFSPRAYMDWLKRETVTKHELREEFAEVMRENMTGESFNLLPSQAAKIVGDRYGLDAAQVLLAFAKN